MTEQMTGVCHVHSTWSDGEFQLQELREVLQRDGYRFAIMGDHAEAMNAARRDAYARMLADLSGDEFLFIPGIEVTCERGMHILSLGAIPPDVGTRPEEVLAAIAGVGGLSVIAHPKDDHLQWIEGFARLPQGLEVWNTKYDGPQAPRRRVLELFARLRTCSPDLRAFYGLDLHWKQQPRPLALRISSGQTDGPSIIAALAAGRYVGVHGTKQLPSDGRVPEAWLEEWEPLSTAYLSRRQRLRAISKFLGSPGRLLPAGVKSFLRRFL